MHIIEVKSENLCWVAAVYFHENAGKDYLNLLKQAGHSHIEIKKLSVNDFPVYAIERTHSDEMGEINYFEYMDEAGYFSLIGQQKQNKYHTDNFGLYFTAYYFNEDYFQHPYDKSFMGTVNHVYVDNYYLESEDAEKSLGETYIKRLVKNLNLDELDNIFDTYIKKGSTEQKKELGDAYYDSFCDMSYDFACGKLTDYGISLLLPVLDKASLLLKEDLLEAYVSAHMTLLEDAIEKHPDKVNEYFQSAVNILEQFMKESPENEQEGKRNLGLVHEMMTEYHHFNLDFWSKSITYIKESIQIKPIEGDWFSYLKLLYVPYEIRRTQKIDSNTAVDELYRQWDEYRIKEIGVFKPFVKTMIDTDSNSSLPLALAYKRLKEYLVWLKDDLASFPENDYGYWINEAKQWQGQNTTRIDLTEAAFFFKAEGIRLDKIDLLETATRLFQKLIDKLEDTAFEVNYLAETWEAISNIHLKNKKYVLADKYLNKTVLLYDQFTNKVYSNPSVLMHYTKFLERCYLYPGNIVKPTLEKIKSLAQQTEEEGEGMYSEPTMLRIRLALYENKEKEAVFHVTRMLLQHELCIEDALRSLQQNPIVTPFPHLQEFLKDTLIFMKEIEENYYLDTKIKWDQLKVMDQDEIASSWEKRKIELKNREKLKWE